MARGQGSPARVIEDLRSCHGRYGERRKFLVFGLAHVLEGYERPANWCNGTCVTVGEPRRDGVEEEVGGAGQVSRRVRSRAYELGYVARVDTRGESAGEHCSRERFKVRIPRKRYVERLETFSRREKERRHLRAAVPSERDLCA